MLKKDGKAKRAMKVNKVIVVIFIGVLGFMCKKGTEPSSNSSPVITNIIPSKTHVNFSDSVTVEVVAYDPEGDSLRYRWSSSSGYLYNISSPVAKWVAPDTSGTASVSVRVSDGQGGASVDSTHIIIGNQKPIITNLYVEKYNVLVGNSIRLICTAYDPDEDDIITIKWEATDGSFSTSEGDSTRWTAPNINKSVIITLSVIDQHNTATTREININVYQELGSLWITDTFNGQVVKLSPIGLELERKSEFSQPEGIAIDLNDRTVFVADNGSDEVIKISSTGEILKRKSLTLPVDLDVYYLTGEVWVIHSGDSAQITIYSGDLEEVKTKIKGLNNPQAVSINQVTGEAWVADTENDRVIKFYGDLPSRYDVENAKPDSTFHSVFTIINETNLLNPIDVSVNSSSGDCWVSDKDNDRVVKISPIGSNVEIFGFSSPRGISVNKKDGSCWVADTENNRIIKLDPKINQVSGINIQNISGFHIAIDGYQTPWAVSVNYESGYCWASEDHLILKISADGDVEKTITGFNLPRAIAVNPGQ